MIDQLKWGITLGECDILEHVMSMSRFRLAPKTGHLERRKRLFGYLAKTNHFAIRYITKEPDYSHYQNMIMNGLGLSIEMLKKKSQRMYPSH